MTTRRIASPPPQMAVPPPQQPAPPPPELGPAHPPQPLPVETELDAIRTGLEPEQECRARALDSAARLLAPVLGNRSLDAVDLDLDRIARLWLDLAGRGVEHIRDGHQPEAEPELPCNCTQVPGKSNVRDGTQCPQHNPLVRETWSQPTRAVVCYCTERELTTQRWRSDCPQHGTKAGAS